MFDCHDHYDRSLFSMFDCIRYVKSLLIHVGGTRCVTSSTGNMLNIQARIHCEGCMYPNFVYVIFLRWKYKDEYDQD